MLAGVNRWTEYGALMVTDAGIRVAVAAATFVLGWGLAGFLWATVAGAVAWLIMLIAAPAARLARWAADRGQSRDVPARGRAFDRRGRRQRDPGDGIPGAAQGHVG